VQGESRNLSGVLAVLISLPSLARCRASLQQAEGPAASPRQSAHHHNVVQQRDGRRHRRGGGWRSGRCGGGGSSGCLHTKGGRVCSRKPTHARSSPRSGYYGGKCAVGEVCRGCFMLLWLCVCVGRRGAARRVGGERRRAAALTPPQCVRACMLLQLPLRLHPACPASPCTPLCPCDRRRAKRGSVAAAVRQHPKGQAHPKGQEE